MENPREVDDFPGLDQPAPGQYPYRYTQDDRFQYRVRIQPVAGHREFYIRAVDTRLPAMADQRRFMGSPKRLYNVQQDPADRLDNQLKATQRAKRKVRLLCMEAGVDRMFTFTTRALLDRDLLLKAWDRFRRVMEANWKEFRYVATIEPHKSGQLHIHAGMSGFHNINHLRKLWHSCLNRALGRSQTLVHGSDSPGNVNIPKTRSRTRYAGVKGATAIAGYIAKYVGKELTEDFNRKKYLHTKNVKLNPAFSLWLEADDLGEAITEVARYYGFVECLDDLKVFKGSAFIRLHLDDLPPPF
jgi:hypothetical protein